MDGVIYINGVTEENKYDKFEQIVKALSEKLSIPATIDNSKKSEKEEFPFQAQQELYDLYIYRTGSFMDDLYSRVCSSLGMNPVSTFQKSIDQNAPKFGKEIIWNPETGQPIGEKEFNKLINAIDKYMNRNLGNMKKEFVLNQATIGRILANLKGAGSSDDLRNIPLDELKFKDKPWLYYNTYQRLQDSFPGDYDRLKFRERVAGNYIKDITEQTKSKIVNTIDEGFLSGKTKSEISQELFDQFGSLNKNWDRIIDTEGVNIFNSQYIEEQRKDVEPGEDLYFIRREFRDGVTCSFCIKATGEQIIAKWSDTALQDEKIKDPVASIAIWSGKTNHGRQRSDWWWSETTNHPFCYSDDTEVLTDSGWKLFKDVNPLDQIMSINPDTREVGYVHHNGLISYQYDGDMIHFDGLNYDKLVTPDHNCLYKKGGKGVNLSQGKAVDLLGTDVMLPRAVGLWYGFDYELEKQAKLIDMNPIIYTKLWGWFLSEGNVRTYDNRHEIKLSQKDPMNIINDIGRDLRFKMAKDAIYILDRDTVSLFSEYNGVHAEQKYIPQFITGSSVKYQEIFINSFMLGDGTIRKKIASKKIYGESIEKIIRTSSPRMMAQLSEMIIKSGKFCSISKTDQKGVPITHHNGTYVGNTDCYIINITKSKFRHYHKSPQFNKSTGLYSKSIQKVHYSGMVYDVELIKWHFLLVKRNGKLAWSGNCRGSWDRFYPEVGEIEL